MDCGGTRGQRETNTTWLQRMGEEEVARIFKERELCREGCLEGVGGESSCLLGRGTASPM